MKKLFLPTILFLLIFTACATNESNDNTEQWLEYANLLAEETPQELYEKALEEDVLTIYSVSSRVMDVAASFQEQYPGLQVDVIYTRSEELVQELTEATESDENKCDLIFSTNGDGSLTENLIPNELVYKYIPYDMKDKMRSESNESYLSVLMEVPLLAYNSQYYQSPPIENWWELTEEQWKDNVYITNPMRSMISYTVFSTMLQEEQLMEDAYLQRYGIDFESDNDESASQAFLRMLVENGLVVVNDSDDVADAIAKPGIESSAVGILNTSKLRLRENGYPLEVSYITEPFAGVINPANIMVVSGSESIHSAKLFIRWILGEADGTGEGYQPFLQYGAWSSRTDVDTPSPELESFNAIYTDESYASENRQDFITFWESLLQ